MGVISQCINPMVLRNRSQSGWEDVQEDPPRIVDIDAYARHVVTFSLAGIRGSTGGGRGAS